MLTIHADKKELMGALRLLKPLTDTGSSKPILSNVRLTARAGSTPVSSYTDLSRRYWNGAGGDIDAGRLALFATDYEQALGLEIDGTVTGAGTVLLPCSRLLAVLKTAPNGPVMIAEQDDQWITVEAGPVKLRLPGCDPGLYPGADSHAMPLRWSMTGVDMARAIAVTIPCALQNEARRNLMGVCFRQHGGTAQFLATDGHRLARVVLPVDTTEQESGESIIPLAVLKVWAAALKARHPEMVAVHFGEEAGGRGEFAFMARGMMFTGRTVEGRFPEVDQMIPADGDKSFTVSPKPFKSLLDSAIAMSSEKIKPVKLTVKDGTVTAESERAEYGDTAQTINAETEGDIGDGVSIGLNAAYVADILKAANGHGALKIALNGPLNPLLCTFPEDPSYTGVVMPLRIEW